jgi:hypothetical protein
MATTTTTTTLLPMWRSPTASTCSSRTPHLLRLQDSWDDDEAYAPHSAPSPTRFVQCLKEPAFQLHIFLSEDGDNDNDNRFPTNSQQSTYQIERTLAEFEQLRDDVLYWTSRKSTACTFCSDFQTQSRAWEQHWPRTRSIRRLFGLSKTPRDDILDAVLDDVVALARSQLRYGEEPCDALHHVPALVTSFLVRHELFMDE